MKRSMFTCLTSVVATFVLASAASAQATINYQGFLYSLSGLPVQNGRVIAGTFKPGFNVDNFTCIYGDNVCNLNDNNYTQAVADGNFIPAGAGVLTGFNGAFSGSGFSSAPAGSKVWIFGFPTSQTSPQPDYTEVLASSSDPSFIVPAGGTATINASLANQFELGQKFSNGLQLTSIPIPEPSAAAVLAICLLTFSIQRRPLPFRSR